MRFLLALVMLAGCVLAQSHNVRFPASVSVTSFGNGALIVHDRPEDMEFVSFLDPAQGYTAIRLRVLAYGVITDVRKSGCTIDIVNIPAGTPPYPYPWDSWPWIGIGMPVTMGHTSGPVTHWYTRTDHPATLYVFLVEVL